LVGASHGIGVSACEMSKSTLLMRQRYKCPGYLIIHALLA